MIMIPYGTRPEAIKLSPIINLLGDKCRPIKFHQHTDLLKEFNFRNSIDITPHCNNDIRLNEIVESILHISDMPFNRCKAVMVQGDTSTAFGFALQAFHRKLPIIHVEAGLRTGDLSNPYPEEFNRRAISCMATVNLCPTKDNAKLLFKENVPGRIYIVGNTVLDNLKHLKPTYGNTVLCTYHRRENLDELQLFYTQLGNIARDNPGLTFKYVMHPNQRDNKYIPLLDGVQIVDSMPYNLMMREVANCRFVITDSGGLQEECSFLRKKVIVMRKTTERPESIGTSTIMCTNIKMLYNQVKRTIDDYTIDNNIPCPFGDGTASQQIVSILKELNYA